MYLSMKQGCLFVLFGINKIHQTGMLQIVFLVSLESSPRGDTYIDNAQKEAKMKFSCIKL
jgi:hypothetical protein